MGSRGAPAERELVQLLRRRGIFAVRAPGSLGVADVFAYIPHANRTILFEAKSTRRHTRRGAVLYLTSQNARPLEQLALLVKTCQRYSGLEPWVAVRATNLRVDESHGRWRFFDTTTFPGRTVLHWEDGCDFTTMIRTPAPAAGKPPGLPPIETPGGRAPPTEASADA